MEAAENFASLGTLPVPVSVLLCSIARAALPLAQTPTPHGKAVLG